MEKLVSFTSALLISLERKVRKKILDFNETFVHFSVQGGRITLELKKFFFYVGFACVHSLKRWLVRKTSIGTVSDD